MKYKILLLFFVLSVFLVSCDEDESIPKVVFDLEEFQTNRAKWVESNLQDYTYEYVSAGFLYSHLQIEMRNGEISSVRTLAQEGFQSGDTLTIDGLFDEIIKRYPEDGIPDAHSDDDVYIKEIQVEYDDQYHFPTEVHYLLHIPDAVEVDGNFDRYIKNFVLVD